MLRLRDKGIDIGDYNGRRLRMRKEKLYQQYRKEGTTTPLATMNRDS